MSKCLILAVSFLLAVPSLLVAQESRPGEMVGYLLVPNERVPETFGGDLVMLPEYIRLE